MNLPLNIPGLTDALATASPRFIDLWQAHSAPDGIAGEISAGLLAPNATVSPKFFYDELGSKLFEAITGLPEYYPTRVEAGIFADCLPAIAARIAASGVAQPCLVDLGAGNCAKAMTLMPQLQPSQYVPVDISVDFLREAAAQVQNNFPALDIVGVGMDFSAGLRLPEQVQAHDRVFFYPGSSLGNFAPADALAFLRQITDASQGNARGLLIGIDLAKDPATLEAAYDDALGVTAAFNKNLLRHLNGLLGSDFDVRDWRHVALFNEDESRIEMHLEARLDLVVNWPGQRRAFRACERIHTECSYKYTPASMAALLREAGFANIEHWTDSAAQFAVFWAEN